MKRTRTTSSSVASFSAPPTDHKAHAADHVPKYASLSPRRHTSRGIRCNLPPHEPLIFDELAAYETHYTAQHSHRCVECFINLPSAHILELHLAEYHDPFQAARRDAGEKTFACFVEGCDKVCSDWRKRRSHLVDKHGFPRNYDFFVVKTGIDGRSSLLRPGIDSDGHRKSSRERSNKSDLDRDVDACAQDKEEHDTSQTDSNVRVVDHENADGPQHTLQDEPPEDGIAAISSGMAGLQVVIPSAIRFGRQKHKTGFAKK